MGWAQVRSRAVLFAICFSSFVVSGCTAMTEFRQGDLPPLTPINYTFVGQWLQDPNRKPLNADFVTFYAQACPSSDSSGAFFSRCVGRVTRAAVDVCIYQTYRQSFRSQFSNLGLSGILIAAAAATGISALLHEPSSTTTDVAAGVAATGAIVAATQKDVPAQAQSAISAMQQTAVAYLSIGAPNYRQPTLSPGPDIAAGTKPTNPSNTSASQKMNQYWCPDPMPVAGGGSAQSQSAGCYTRWVVLDSKFQKLDVQPDIPQENIGPPDWSQTEFARFYDAVLSSCPSGVL